MKTENIHSLTPLHFSNDFGGDTLGYLFFQNDKKEPAFNKQTLTEFHDLSKSGAFSAAAKSTCFIRASYIEKKNLLAAGLGPKKGFTPEKARQTGAMAYGKVVAEKCKHFGIEVDDLLTLGSKDQVEKILVAFLEGFYLASYSFEKYKSSGKSTTKLEHISLYSAQKKNQAWLEKVAHQVQTTVDCIFVTRDFSNEPSNYGTPEFYADEISKFCKKYGMKCKVLGEAEAKKEGMTLFLAVGEGSTRESKVVIMEYTPKTGGKSAKTVSLVGKGVTFDSGGISIKPSMRMEDMKHDMTGAATMVGSTLLAARMGSKNKIITILVFCENMPSGNATQPGNVIKSRSGKTVEIINTDAEGRLVLADALDLAQDYKPDVLVNSATLTGACSVALGKLCSALFGNDDKLIRQLKDVASSTEEALWELPTWDEYFEDIRSTCADMMNSANDSYGGTIRGAVFLKQFIRPGTRWAHVDLANRAYDQGFLPYNPRKGATGTYVRTFAEFAMTFKG